MTISVNTARWTAAHVWINVTVIALLTSYIVSVIHLARYAVKTHLTVPAYSNVNIAIWM